MEDYLQKASMEDLRERYGDYPVWAAIQQAYELGIIMEYAKGFNDAAKDPSAWCVEDHGEVFKLGDRVWIRDKESRLVGFYLNSNCSSHIQPTLLGYGQTEFRCITHNNPDSWEKLQADIANAVHSVCIAEYEAASFITRAKKLGGCDE